MKTGRITQQTTLAKIKHQYRHILLTGRIKSIEKRTKRLNVFTLHILKNY